jgi:predicted lipoprotein
LPKQTHQLVAFAFGISKYQVMKSTFAKIVFFLFTSLLVWSCGDDEEKVIYKDLFTNVSSNMIQPRLGQYLENCQTLDQKTKAFTQNPSTTSLEDLRTAFKENYKQWQWVSLYNFGPAKEASVLLNAAVNSFPTLPAKIEQNISTGSYNLESASNIYASGLPALDYLLFAPQKTNLEIITAFSDVKRKKYLEDISSRLVNKVKETESKWTSYHNTFINDEGTGLSSSLTLLFNAILEDYEYTKRNRFALPAGFATEFSIPISKDAKKVEAPYSNLSYVLIMENIKAHQEFYMGYTFDGNDGVGFYDKLKDVQFKSTVVEGDLAKAIADQFTIILEDQKKYEGKNFATDITNDLNTLSPSYSKLQKMVPLLKGDLRSFLSVPISGSDADGD